jgi:hypothetical protein
MSLTAKGKIKQESRLNLDNTIYDFEIDFDTISDLEDFISYNRNQIVEIRFTGKLKREI